MTRHGIARLNPIDRLIDFAVEVRPSGAQSALPAGPIPACPGSRESSARRPRIEVEFPVTGVAARPPSWVSRRVVGCSSSRSRARSRGIASSGPRDPGTERVAPRSRRLPCVLVPSCRLPCLFDISMRGGRKWRRCRGLSELHSGRSRYLRAGIGSAAGRSTIEIEGSESSWAQPADLATVNTVEPLEHNARARIMRTSGVKVMEFFQLDAGQRPADSAGRRLIDPAHPIGSDSRLGRSGTASSPNRSTRSWGRRDPGIRPRWSRTILFVDGRLTA